MRWLLWLPRDKHILFVYSDSPIWHDYIEQHILPVIREHAVVLNWSQRRSRSWRRSLACAAPAAYRPRTGCAALRSR